MALQMAMTLITFSLESGDDLGLYFVHRQNTTTRMEWEYFQISLQETQHCVGQGSIFANCQAIVSVTLID